MKVKLTLAAALAVLAASPLAAQRRMIAPGMSPEQVRDVFGAPARTRDTGEWTYWFYSNGCPNRCGSDDVVFFRGGQVVTAVLRTRTRSISGPPAAEAIGDAGGAADASAIRATAAPETGPAPAPGRQGRQGRIIVRGRSRERNGTLPPAEVGGVSVQRGAPGTAGAVRDNPPVTPLQRSGSNNSAANDGAAPTQGGGQSTIIRSGQPGAVTAPGATTGAAPATGVNGLTAPGATPAPVTGTQTENGRTFTAPGVITSGAQPPATLTDTTGAGRATSVDDERSARESKVTRTTVPNQPDTIQSRRRDRENSVTPRVVPRP
jgi:hypothetical protein